MSETISVIIPVYNAAPFIEKAVASVMAQELLPDEVIIVDDGSTDETQRIINKLVSTQDDKKPRIKCIHQTNRGPALARNAGIAIAVGDYIAFLDADDRWTPSRLKKQMEIFRARPEVGLVCSGRFRVNEATSHKTEDCVGKTLTNDSYRDLWKRGNYVITSSVLTPKKCFDIVGNFNEDPRILGAEDAEMWLRLAERFPIAYIDEPLVEYAVRQEGLNRSNIQRAYESAVFVIQKCEPEFRRRYTDAEIIIRQRWGRVYHAWGMALFSMEHFSKAREKFYKALVSSRPTGKTIFFFLATLLGTRILLFIKTLIKGRN